MEPTFEYLVTYYKVAGETNSLLGLLFIALGIILAGLTLYGVSRNFAFDTIGKAIMGFLALFMIVFGVVHHVHGMKQSKAPEAYAERAMYYFNHPGYPTEIADRLNPGN